MIYKWMDSKYGPVFWGVYFENPQFYVLFVDSFFQVRAFSAINCNLLFWRRTYLLTFTPPAYLPLLFWRPNLLDSVNQMAYFLNSVSF